jgi:two-component system response regulator FlrC
MLDAVLQSNTNRVVLVVEDDNSLREALCDTLELSGYRVIQAAHAEAALEHLELAQVDMIVSDVNMPGMDGHDLLKEVRSRYPVIPMLLITAYGSIERSVDAIRNGAVDYLVKPFEPLALVDCVKRFTGSNDNAEEEPVACEPESKQLLQLARRVAETDSTVLIGGESGTGKEVLARYIHRHSSRATGPFVAINCAAIPENMLESVLFGHEKGAFTGAYNSAPGKFEQANGGTLLLDEISEMDLGLQAKILRVLQEREVERVGGRKLIELDVRIIATTNRRLQEEVAAGRFREDLYYRLSVFPLEWRPLRDRAADIIPLAGRLLAEHADKMHRKGVSFDESAIAALLGHGWQGNVRELDNVVQRALIMQPGSIISAAHLRLDTGVTAALQPQTDAIASMPDQNEPPGASQLDDDLKRREYEIILDALRAEKGIRKKVAEKLGISPRTLRYKLARMRELGFDPDQLISA